jgi:hypothetical protein
MTITPKTRIGRRPCALVAEGTRNIWLEATG